ncbi:uncharacterized protein LOC131225815 [Magnolia sinica]|uniref:uncharacterized protein LOC131225815 n=1 Tax=Magnolia sinica TaxID=86752 RepID=UPI00265B2645|nr:uncharacterized protein LOC131225815 [Magnolia sinica]
MTRLLRDVLFVALLHGSEGVEARGFIFGPPIALAFGAKFVPLRKPRNLPGISSNFKYPHIFLLSFGAALRKSINGK